MFYSVMDTIEVHVWADDGTGNPGTDLYVDTLIVSTLYPNPEIIDLSGEDIVVDGDFHIGLAWLGADTPYPMCDNGASTTRSKWDPGTGWVAVGYDWVMSAVVTYVAPTPDAVVSKSSRVSTVATLGAKNTAASARASERLTRHEIGRTCDLSTNLLERILGISNFEVERSVVQGGPYTSVGTSTSSYYVDNTVATDNRYYYVVKANYVAPDTASYYSNEVNIGVDFNPPVYTNTAYDSLVGGPWVVSSDITEWIGLAYDSLGYRADGGTFAYVTSDSVSGNTYYYTIPSYPSYTLIEFYLFSQDTSWLQNTGRDPLTGYYSFHVTGIAEFKQYTIPDHVFFNQNRPNPFSHLTQFEYGVPRSMYVDISVYNAAGQIVRTLVNEVKAPGYHMVSWQGADDMGRTLAEGVYFVRITTDELVATKKIIHIR
jgi:hypothetical protein